MKIKFLFLMLFILSCCSRSNRCFAQEEDIRSQRVLVFTKTEGYRHKSVSEGVSLIKTLGSEHDFNVDHTEDANEFTRELLEKYSLVIFLSTTGDILSSEQQEAFEKYIRAGGSFMGIHAAADTEYNWPWYGSLVGARFESHPSVQKAEVRVVDKAHPSTAFLPDIWERTDEWYNFMEMRSGLKVLLDLDERSYQGGTDGVSHPVAWYQEFDGGRSFYTAGGHSREAFSEPLFANHILGGIRWCLNRTR